MPAGTSDSFVFPDSMLPHTGFLRKHFYMIEALKTALANNADIKILEVGSWIGASCLLMAQSLMSYNNAKGSIHCIDNWTPIMSSGDLDYEKNKYYTSLSEDDLAFKLYKHNISVGKKKFGIDITYQRGLSEDILPTIESESFDFIFIDACHYYESVKWDIKDCKRILKNGGILCGDDFDFRLEEIDADFARANLNRDLIEDPKTKQHYHPGVTLAVSEEIESFFADSGFWACRKQDGAYQAVALTPTDIIVPFFVDPDELTRERAST